MQLTNRRLYFLTLALLTGFCILGIETQGTYDDGDSIMHYLIARYAGQHPWLLLDHWGKPVFTTLAAPFAAQGFTGMKIFNCLVAALCALLTCLSARKMGFRLYLLSTLFIYSAPAFLLSQYSGLTEPLFALFMIAAFYCVVSGKPVTAAVFISFLPFIRSEGLVIMIIFGVYWLVKRRFRVIPWLAAGNVVYALIGGIFKKDLLWAFHQIPYAGTEAKYGHGDDWMHFITQLYYIIGLPLFVLFFLGAVMVLFTWLFNGKKVTDPFFTDAQVWLLCGCCAGFIAAHTIFWQFGLFHSFGLNRVLISIIPYIVLLCLVPLEKAMALGKIARVSIIILAAVAVAGFPYTKNKAALHLEKDFRLTAGQEAIKQASAWLEREHGLAYPLYVAAPYWYETLHLDPFDKTRSMQAHNLKFPGVQKGSLVLWDDYFMESDQNMEPAFFADSTRFEMIYTGNHTTAGRKAQVRIYQVK